MIYEKFKNSIDLEIITFTKLGMMHIIRNAIQYTVESRYPDTLRTRKKFRHKRSVTVTGVGETYNYKKLYFL